MNEYQVILPNSDVLKLKADRAVRDGCYLNFYDGEDIKAQFGVWQGWNLLGPVDVPECAKLPDRTPVADLPTGPHD